jgi:ParB family chromosome partitioning protein
MEKRKNEAVSEGFTTSHAGTCAQKLRKKAFSKKEAQFEEKVFPGGTPFTSLKLSDIIINPKWVLRDEDELRLERMIKSLKRGFLQPVGVRPKNEKYELVYGYRRYKAAQKAGLKEIPAIVLNVDDEEAALLKGVENIQRRNLNPMKEAEYFMKLQREFGLSAREIARRLGLDVKYVTRRLQLLKLNPDVQECVYRGKLPFRLALELLKVKEPKHQAELANQYCMGQISRKEFLAKVNLASKLSERVMPREPVSIEQRTFTCFICGLQRPLNVRGGQILNNSICSTCAQWLLEEIIKIRREKGSTT